MNFSQALDLLKEGKLMRRETWQDERYVYLVRGSTFTVNRPPLLGIMTEGTVVNYLPHLDTRTVDGNYVPWTISQEDVMADDWEFS